MFKKDSKIDAVASSVMQVIEKVTTDTTKGREVGSINSFTPAKFTVKGDIEKAPEGKKPEKTPARKSIEPKSPDSGAELQSEVSPPGWSGTVKAMKKHKNISNPFALAWSMKNKGAKSHIKAEETEIVDESVIGALKAGVKKGLEKLGGGTDKDQLQRLRDNMYGKKKPEVKEEAESVEEALKGNQKKIDKNKNGEIDAEDFKILRKEDTVEEGWDDMLKSVADKKKPQPNGGSGIKKGKSYGNQKPEKEDDKDVKEGWEGSAEDKSEDKKEAKKRHMSMKEWEKSAADKKHDMKEAKTLSPGQDDAPFEPPYKEKPETVTDKSGAKHTPMSRAKNLARAAMDKIKKDHKLG